MIVEKHLHIDLIKKVKQGSYEDFTRLYFMYADLLYGFVLNLTKSPDDAEDILQETFLRIWQTKENLSLETSFKSYLYTIAHIVRKLIVLHLKFIFKVTHIRIIQKIIQKMKFILMNFLIN